MTPSPDWSHALCVNFAPDLARDQRRVIRKLTAEAQRRNRPVTSPCVDTAALTWLHEGYISSIFKRLLQKL